VNPCRVHDDDRAVSRPPRSDGIDGIGAQLERLNLYTPLFEKFFRANLILRVSANLCSQPVGDKVALVVGIPFGTLGDLLECYCRQCVQRRSSP
jgi:hypothetical protein